MFLFILHIFLMAEIMSELEKARNTKSTRLWFLVFLAVVLFVLWWFKIIKTGFAVGLGIIVLAAIGIETFNYDLDLGTLWRTGNIQESRVTHTHD
jgi:O-antigen ligase